MSDTTQIQPVSDDALALTREMAGAYRSMVEWYRQTLAPELKEEIARFEAPLPGRWEEIQHKLHAEPHSIEWFDLKDVSHDGAHLPGEIWQQLREIAKRERQGGGHLGDVSKTAHGEKPLDRARMFALREELRRDWQPQNGIETAIIDQMALAHWQVFEWMERLHCTNALCSDTLTREDKEGKFTGQLPRVSQAEAVATAAAMIDRFNRIFLRCVRSLRDLRRYPVTINAPGAQVNVGDKQINVAT